MQLQPEKFQAINDVCTTWNSLRVACSSRMCCSQRQWNQSGQHMGCRAMMLDGLYRLKEAWLATIDRQVMRCFTTAPGNGSAWNMDYRIKKAIDYQWPIWIGNRFDVVFSFITSLTYQQKWLLSSIGAGHIRGGECDVLSDESVSASSGVVRKQCVLVRRLRRCGQPWCTLTWEGSRSAAFVERRLHTTD